jgi:hypothetical protein
VMGDSAPILTAIGWVTHVGSCAEMFLASELLSTPSPLSHSCLPSLPSCPFPSFLPNVLLALPFRLFSSFPSAQASHPAAPSSHRKLSASPFMVTPKAVMVQNTARCLPIATLLLIYIYTHIHVHTRIYIHVHTRIYIYMYIHAYIYKYIYNIYICICICICIDIHVCLYIHIYMNIHVYTRASISLYTSIYIYIYIYIYI